MLRHAKSVVARPSRYARFRAARKQVMSRFSVLADRRWPRRPPLRVGSSLRDLRQPSSCVGVSLGNSVAASFAWFST